MSTLFLTAKPNLPGLLQHCDGRFPEATANIVHGRAYLRDLVPLTWKFDAKFENGNSVELTRFAAEMMCIQNINPLEIEKAKRAGKIEYLNAVTGDIIVVLPMANQLRFGNYHSRREKLEDHEVVVVFVGKSLPADIAHVFRKINWKSFSLAEGNDLEAAVRANGSKIVTVFDALKMGQSAHSVEAFQKQNFPGRSEVKLAELLPFLRNTNVERLVRHVLGAKSGHRESFSSSRAYNLRGCNVLATELGLPSFD